MTISTSAFLRGSTMLAAFAAFSLANAAQAQTLACVDPANSSAGLGSQTAAPDILVMRVQGPGIPPPPSLESQNATVCGANASALGASSVALGHDASVAAPVAIGDRSSVPTPGAIAIGTYARVDASAGVAIGYASSVLTQGSVAIGAFSSVLTQSSVAIGAFSLADRDYVVSVGSADFQRQIVNVAAGTEGTDAVNLTQLDVVRSVANDANANAAAASASAAIALANAATAQTTANQAVAENVIQDTRISTVENENTAQATQISAIQSTNTTQDSRLTAAELLNTTQNGKLTALESLVGQTDVRVESNRREANAGIAAAMALGGTIMPADANVAMSFNLATYRGQQGFSGVVVAKASEHVYVNAGVAGSTVKGSTGGRVGVTFAW
jgi:trimeric autotransporter adhesin